MWYKKLYFIFVSQSQVAVKNFQKMSKAIVNFTDGTKSKVIVNSAYSRGGVHYYNLTINKLNTFLSFAAGITKTFTGEDIVSLTYTMD